MKQLGAYIHIPFCKQKCLYCDFISYANKENLQEEYVKAIIKEIENWKNKNLDATIKTVYIGGGTPSYLESKYIKAILETLLKDQNKQISITIEVNPGTVDESKLHEYKNAGVNRLSIGLQSTNNQILKKIGRIHSFEDFLSTYQTARDVGFQNINVDLMIALPGQTIQDVKQSLENITKLNPEHISIYSLILEDGTPMQKLVEEKKLSLVDEETERQMYWYVKNYLELKGYKHYEISNFAKEGFESEHNIDCWNQKEYIGFGLAAHSYIESKRFCNISDLNKYIQNCGNNEFEKNVIINEIQNKDDKMREFFIIGLRKIDGVSIQNFENIFNENPIMLFRKQLQYLCEQGLLTIDGDCIKLTNKGLDFANLVWEEFI